MARTLTDGYSLVHGAVRSANLMYIVLVGDEATSRRLPHAIFMLWDKVEWYHCSDQRWDAVGIAVVHKPMSQMVAIGRWGEVLCLGSGDTHDEHVASNGQRAPSDRGPLTGARRIGDAIYAVGMDRQVYRRSAPNTWTEIGPGMTVAEVKEVKGFQAIDGFDEHDIYAVGWDGEIWHYDGAVWTQMPSITSAVLIDVCCGQDGMVYICGRERLLLKGRNREWSAVNTAGLSEDLWSIAWYNGQLYLAGMTSVYTLSHEGPTQIFMGEDTVRTCHRLAADEGVLWSIGAKDLMAFDGVTWTRIE